MTAHTRGIAFALLFSAAPLYAAETKTIDKTLPLSATGAVTLDAHNSAIQIRTWDRPDVEIHIQISAHGSSSDARRRVDETTIDISGSRDLVTIRAERPDFSSVSLWSWLMSSGDWNTRPDVRYTITAPRTARWSIREHNGSVWMAGQSGPVDLRMHNGDAHIDFASFAQESRITTHNGTVEVALPASSRFDLHSIGHRMHVDSDFPGVVRSSDFGRHTMVSRVNGGGPELRVTGHNGGFRLRSK